MKILLVGLGNPEQQYALTRHNVGFLTLDKLAVEWNCSFIDKTTYRIARTTQGLHEITLVQPCTGMNVSGKPLIQLVGSYDRIIVIYDDLDMEVGRVRIKKAGSGAGGHNGIKSITECIGSNFDRIKIGIGRPQGVSVVGWVLSRPSELDMQRLASSYEDVKTKILSLVQEYERELSQTS